MRSPQRGNHQVVARTKKAAAFEQVTVVAPALSLAVSVHLLPDESHQVHFHAGGQGFWVARMAARLGADVTLCAPVGGEPGQVLRGLVEAEGVALQAVETEAWSSVWLSDGRSGDDATIVETEPSPLSRHELDDLYGQALTTGLRTRVVVFTGTAQDGIVPPDLYRRLAVDLGSNDVLVVTDVSGANLDAALRGKPWLVKVSEEELTGGTAGDVQAGLRAIARLRRRGARNVMLSRAAHPALVHAGDRIIEVEPPALEAYNHRGAGDSMTAALAVSLSRGAELDDALRLAAAAGSLNVTREGLGTGDRESIERIMEFVELREIRPRTAKAKSSRRSG